MTSGPWLPTVTGSHMTLQLECLDQTLCRAILKVEEVIFSIATLSEWRGRSQLSWYQFVCISWTFFRYPLLPSPHQPGMRSGLGGHFSSEGWGGGMFGGWVWLWLHFFWPPYEHLSSTCLHSPPPPPPRSSCRGGICVLRLVFAILRGGQRVFEGGLSTWFTHTHYRLDQSRSAKQSRD